MVDGNINSRRMWVLLTALVVISSCVFIWDSFRDDYFCKFDSPVYATISQNILRTGDWLNLRSSFDAPFENNHPPLVFWATAISLKLLGENAFAVAFFSILCAIGTCIVLFFIGTFLKNEYVGFFSAIGLILTRYVPRVARYNTLEIPLMFFIALSVLFLILALNKNRIFYILFGLSTALCILSKGVIGFSPFVICFFAILFQKRYKDFFSLSFIMGIFLALALPCVWLFLKGGCTVEGTSQVLSGYLHFALPAFTGSENRGNAGTRLFFIQKLIETCFMIMPGVVLGLFFLGREVIREKRRELLVILVWALMFIIGYSISSWRRAFYLLPMYPAMALLFGIGLYEIIPKTYSKWSVYLIMAFFVGNISAPFLFSPWAPKKPKGVIARRVNFPRARKAVKALYKQFPGGMRFVAYNQRDPNEFIFFFRSEFDIELCEKEEEFKKLVISEEPILFYISKYNFSGMDKRVYEKLKIVYAFNDQLIATNQQEAIPVFDVE